MFRRILLLSYIIVLLVSCQTPSDPVTPTLTPTLEATATETAVPPTNTPSPPTATPMPTATAIPLDGTIQSLVDDNLIHPFEPFVIEFNQQLDIDSTERLLRFTPDIAGEFTWNEAGTEVTFFPESGFERGTSYTIKQASALITPNGSRVFEPLVWRVRTMPAPKAIRQLNMRDMEVVGDDMLITSLIEFNGEMNWQSVVDGFSVEPSVPLMLSWLENGRLQQATIPDAEGTTVEADLDNLPEENQVLVQVSAPFDPNQSYQFSLAETAVDVHDIPLVAPIEREFRASAVEANVFEAALYPDIRLNYQLDLDHVLASLETDPPIVDTVWRAEWDGRDTVLTLDPDVVLPSDQTYTLSFQAPLFHKNGKLLSRPEPVGFKTPAVVTDVFPEEEYWRQYDPETSVAVSFSRPMDEASVEAAFQIEPEVEGELDWISNKLVFQPTNGFLDGFTVYHVTIDTTAQDVEGNFVLDSPYSWRFDTGELHTDADFGVGKMVQVVDANGRRAVQYRSYTREPITVTFGLYDLDQQQALQALRGSQLDSQTLPLAITWTAVTDVENVVEENDWRYVNPQEVIIPAEVSPGAYLMTTDAGVFHDELLVFLSHNTVAAKKAGSQVTIWTTNINDDVAGNLDVVVVDADEQEVANGSSSAEGLFQAQLPTGVDAAYVLVGGGDDLVASGFDHNWRIGSGYYETPPETIIHIHTDRPIYRPGHTVYYKAFLRNNDDVQMEPLPQNSAVTARIRDSRENVVQTFELTTNHFGSVNGEFVLADGAMLGEYHVEIVAPDGHTVSQLFKVEDYRKPDYEVTMSTDADVYLKGDDVSVTVDSAYFFGEPVVNADVSVLLFTRDHSWSDWWTYESPITGHTDENGRFTLELDPREGRYAIEATVDDGNHQSVSGFKQIEVRAEAETVRIDRGSFRKQPDSPIHVDVLVDDIFGDPVANRDVDLELKHYDPNDWDWTKVDSFKGQTDENGRAAFTFDPAEVGYYIVEARITDRLGNRLETSRWIMVYSNAHRYSRWFASSDDLKISGSQDLYLPGDNAQLFIQSSLDGPALLTLQRADVRWQQVVDLTPPMTTVDIAIEDGDAPNIFASVMAWKEQDNSELGENSMPESRLLISTVELPVSLAHKTLTIEIVPDKEQYQPGDEATITLRATNSLGDPASAELSLAVVDEAIFSLSPDLSKAMLDTFYFKRPNQVGNFHAFMPQRRLWYHEYHDGGGMGGGGDGGTNGKPRRDFKDTAAWYPVLQTDANGEVTVTFTLPDNLTSWRMTAKGMTADTQVGETILNVTTWKPTIVRPALPRILTAGDELLLSALIHNNTDDAQPATVTLKIDDSQLTIDNSASQTVTIPANNIVTVGWPVTAVSAGTVTLTVQAEHDGVVLDAIELPLEIQPLAVPDVTTVQGQLTDSFTTDISWPADALPMSTVQIDLNRSIAGSMVQGLEYLTGYPYGCVEQTMSRALPNTVVARAFSQLGVTDPGLLENLEPLINASVQRLYGFQHGDGGWGWWTNDATHDYQTAWVIFGLTTTAEAGYEVDQAVIDRGAKWLNDHVDEMDVRTRALRFTVWRFRGMAMLL